LTSHFSFKDNSATIFKTETNIAESAKSFLDGQKNVLKSCLFDAKQKKAKKDLLEEQRLENTVGRRIKHMVRTLNIKNICINTQQRSEKKNCIRFIDNKKIVNSHFNSE